MEDYVGTKKNVLHDIKKMARKQMGGSLHAKYQGGRHSAQGASAADPVVHKPEAKLTDLKHGDDPEVPEGPTDAGLPGPDDVKKEAQSNVPPARIPEHVKVQVAKQMKEHEAAETPEFEKEEHAENPNEDEDQARLLLELLGKHAKLK